MDPKIFITNSESETQKIGEVIAAGFKKGGLILLSGDLGSGKTTFVKGLATGLGIKKRVISPTYIIHRSYISPSLTLNHLDLFRLSESSKAEELGIEDLICPDSITVIEWPEKLETYFKKFKLVTPVIKMSFEYLNENQRKITLYER